MPVRKVSNCGGNVIGYFPSIKMNRMVAFESSIERDYLYLLDYEPTVAWFEEQPLTLEYQHADKGLRYTPDFHVVEGGRNVLIECKPQALVSREDNGRKAQAAQRWCASHEWEFRVVTDRDIRHGFRLENIKLLTRYARHVISPTLKEYICAVLRTTQTGIPIERMAQELPEVDFSMVGAAVLHLAFHHKVSIPLDDAPILGSTRICLPSVMEVTW